LELLALIVTSGLVPSDSRLHFDSLCSVCLLHPGQNFFSVNLGFAVAARAFVVS